MSPAEKMASVEGFQGEAERRKRLGQYFTGTSLGRVLAALAKAGEARSIIDPMSGDGDLLAACLEIGANPDEMAALDIDPIALESCRKRLPAAQCVLGSAFDPKALGKLPRRQWDLVIANPPYVRYQSISKGSGKTFPLPSAVEIRNGLVSEIDELTGLDEADKDLFRKMAHGYSGLADLAVPSWILAAGLVAPGGRLALVVPESWLSRDYAAVVNYILLRWFDVEFIVEDEHAAWFSDAQVKTTLLVARRVPRRSNAFDFPAGQTFLRIAVSGRASGVAGPCSRLRAGSKEPEKSFASDARGWLASGKGHEDEMIRAYHVPISRTAANLRGACAKQKWFASIGETQEAGGPIIPHEIEVWLGRSTSCAPMSSLGSLGVSVGQGLRTGANRFFYGATEGKKAVRFDKLFPGRSVSVPDGVAVPVVRNQDDLPDAYAVSPEDVAGRVLDMRSVALPEDILAGGDLAAGAYAPMPAALAAFVRDAAKADFGKEGHPAKVWELSAVAPNVRRARPDEGLPPRFWYMLPDFARRHRPDLLMARINAGRTKAFLNKGGRCLIDANFVTLWLDGAAEIDEFALLALLNSSWTAAVLEYSASVMGGGALKVEAAHVRRLPVPSMSPNAAANLSALGRRLARASRRTTIACLLNEIDSTMASAALGREASTEDAAALAALAEAGRGKREKHKNKGNVDDNV